MNISDLKQDYPLVYAAAVENRENSNWKNFHENDLQHAFSWYDTPEKDVFWMAIDKNDFTKAKDLIPRLFEAEVAKKYKYPLGPINLRLNNNDCIPNFVAESHIPKELIRHGLSGAKNCTFEIVGYYGEYYIVKVVDKNGDIRTQLGYTEDKLKPVDNQEAWCVKYSSEFTEEMFTHLVRWCLGRYGTYQRNTVPISWHNFKNTQYSYFWVNSDFAYKYSQDNNPNRCPTLSLDAMLKKINYSPVYKGEIFEEEIFDNDEEWEYEGMHSKSVGIVIPKLNLTPSKADFTIKKIPPLLLDIKPKEFKQVQIIIKSNHVKVNV